MEMLPSLSLGYGEEPVPFYYQLMLGLRRPKPELRKPLELLEPPLIQQHKSWPEGIDRPDDVYEEYPEPRVLEVIQRLAPAPGSRLWVILGEPGAGKTTLLETWFTRWATQLPVLYLGMMVPVLVRLGNVQITHVIQHSEEFADQLWGFGIGEKVLLKGRGEHIYRWDRRRYFHPVWLLDGLDEITPSPSEQFCQALANLPGIKVVSCRTAIYETLRRTDYRYKDREYELLTLTSSQQKTFLTQALGNGHRAEALHQRIQHHSQLRLLARSPFMLSLIAEMPDQVVLPATRIEFYQVVVSEMWRRKLSDHPEALLYTGQRDQVLTELAQRMGMAQIRAPLVWLVQAASHVAGAEAQSLILYLKQAGIVRFHPQEQVDFVHLTFQEFYLAQAFREQELSRVLERYWDDAHYEDTLGLLIAMLFQARQYGDINQGLQWLVEWGEEIHDRTPSILWQRRRSPLRVALHLLHREGIPLEHLPQTEGVLWTRIRRSSRRIRAAVADADTPARILDMIAQGFSGQGISRDIAANDNTSPEVLARLAQKMYWELGWNIAANPNTPPQILAWLFLQYWRNSRAHYINVAGNSSTLPDESGWIVHEHGGTSHATRTPAEVRRDVAGNPDTSSDVLARLAQDANIDVRWRVAANPSTPPEVLARLAQHHDTNVRGRVAANPSTPPEVLARLAQHHYVNARLAQHHDTNVCRDIAANPSTPPEVLARLAQHHDTNVRGRVAANLGIPPEVLARLACDVNGNVRERVAANPGTPPEVLARLACDVNGNVHRHAAVNPSMLPEVLARLAHDADSKVGGWVAANPSTLLEDL